MGPHLRRSIVAFVALSVGCSGGPAEETEREAAGPTEARGNLTVFVILDTVRADHLSACGYTRPTTPVLDQLVSDGASMSCTAVAPGSWTLPSHASFFTGLEVVEHGAHALAHQPEENTPEGERKLGPARALPTDLPTLAELRPAVLVSANPVLGPSSGLDRGFRSTTLATRFATHYGSKLVNAVDTALRDEVRDGDLLVINIADAHQPWKGVPDGVGWVGPQDALSYSPKDPSSLWRRVHLGAEEPAALSRIVDLYDYALWKADRSLGQIIDAVATRGFTMDRLVVTSDHGEHLGEHQLLGHGHYLNDENQIVPLLVKDHVATEQPVLPEGFISATLAHDLVRGLPLEDRPVRAAAWPHAKKRLWFDNGLFDHTSARSWEPEAWWTSPDPVPEGEFGTWVEAVKASGIGGGETALQAELEALGYF